MPLHGREGLQHVGELKGVISTWGNLGKPAAEVARFHQHCLSCVFRRKKHEKKVFFFFG